MCYVIFAVARRLKLTFLFFERLGHMSIGRRIFEANILTKIYDGRAAGITGAMRGAQTVWLAVVAPLLKQSTGALTASPLISYAAIAA